ncbi:MAG: hypothetical protein A2W90_02430 [Bacteroidetes bacterium GWF2_42_66]|nr:MAG: hypothetical protein A2W92_08505 [Bacteroidetes bacterium GWA2_42_15]OFY01207.1 MAG: hypothetical protein A2W89_15915 [Bacteroidetes bacterium GWE2_42_39]OFY42050.1 MAG: hypothetical protein A2W90_02430 [Bacteroidetes bacterium GWF2_42_66]HBL77747.1 hypothetical protein [Prolixibacteraceae bacterium]HCB62876.1 hypothetical protein [Bacteroidales bacterium]
MIYLLLLIGFAVGLYLIIKKKKLDIGFVVPIPDSFCYDQCKKYGYVNFWITSDKKQIIIYAPNCTGGSGEMCRVPPEFQKHILKNNLKIGKIVQLNKNDCIVKLSND